MSTLTPRAVHYLDTQHRPTEYVLYVARGQGAVINTMSWRLYDILGGITSPGDGHLGWFLIDSKSFAVKADIDRNRISAVGLLAVLHS